MEQENQKEPKEEMVSGKSIADSSVTFDSNDRPAPLIRLENQRVNVSVLKISMSRKHRLLMLLDLFNIAWLSGVGVWMCMTEKLAQHVWIIAPIGFLVIICAIGMAIVDFLNWLFTMNKMQTMMGEWYMDDVIGICQDFINAGAKIAADEVTNAVGKKAETEGKDANGESENP
ncbi:MAG: hypothetical protein J6Q22_10130 [Prevotella sp.]|nr:hypothetical protein [Prevotella sp.]